MQRLLRALRELRRQVLIRRRGLAALCAAAATLLAIEAVRPPPPASVPVWSLARDVEVGQTLRYADLRRVRVAADLAPEPRVRDPDRYVGRTVIAPLQRGQPLPPRALLGTPDQSHDRTRMTVRFTDPGLAGLLRPGDSIAVWSADGRGAAAVQVVADALVVAVPEPDPGAAVGGAAGVLVVLAVEDAEVEKLAGVPVSGFLSVAWNR